MACEVVLVLGCPGLPLLFFAALWHSPVLIARPRDTLSLLAYQRVLNDPEFLRTFFFSVQMALWTIVCSVVLIVPTAFWVHLRLPRLRPIIELVTLMPFVIPAVVLVFGLIRTYSGPPFPLVSSPALLVAGYTVLALPYMYRAVDTGLRAVDIRTLTEAALESGRGLAHDLAPRHPPEPARGADQWRISDLCHCHW